MLKIIGGAVAIIVCLWLLAKCGQSIEDDVRDELAFLGYTDAYVQPSMLAFCAKGRWGYRFIATRDGRRAKGYACAGGFMGPSIRETHR